MGPQNTDCEFPCWFHQKMNGFFEFLKRRNLPPKKRNFPPKKRFFFGSFFKQIGVGALETHEKKFVIAAPDLPSSQQKTFRGFSQ